MSGLARKIARQNEKIEFKKKQVVEREEIKEASNHPAVKYTEELMAEIEQLHKKYPQIAMYYKPQIELIRTDCERRMDAEREQKKKIINEMAAKFTKLIDQVEQDFKEKEYWTFMRGMEHERNEIKDIIEKHYGEKIESSQ